MKSYSVYVFSINYYLWLFRRTTRQNTTEDCNIIGPVISIGDFDDGYDIPPPQHPKVSDDSTLEFEIEPFVSFLLI